MGNGISISRLYTQTERLTIKLTLSCPPPHLLVLPGRLLLGLDDDAFQFVEAPLHLCEAQPGVLLVAADSLQLLLAVLLGDAGALLPLLDALRQDLIDPAVEQNERFL